MQCGLPLGSCEVYVAAYQSLLLIGEYQLGHAGRFSLLNNLGFPPFANDHNIGNIDT